MSEPTTNPTILNLDGSVTREEYMGAITRLMTFWHDKLRQRMSWCGERHRYFASIIPEYDTPEYRDKEYGAGEADFSRVSDDADYAERLRHVRARILWYAKSGTINLDLANEMFVASGLPEYGSPGKPVGTRLRVALPEIIINVAGDELASKVWAERHLMEYIVHVMDGKPPLEDAAYVTGSAAFDAGDTADVEVENQEPTIRMEDTIRP